MGDIPPRYNADLEDLLAIPAAPSTTDQQSISSRSASRRWDDPPEDEPTHPPENITTMVFIKAFSIRPFLESEIFSLTFTPNDSHIAGVTSRQPNSRATNPEGPCTIVVWSAANGQRIPQPSAMASSLASSSMRFSRAGFAFKPRTDDMSIACPFLLTNSSSAASAVNYGETVRRLEVYSLALRPQRTLKQDLPIRAPLAWSLDGTVLAAVSARDGSRFVTVAVGKDGAKVERVFAMHGAEVTQLAFLPRRSPVHEVGGVVVSAGRDGYVRVTAVGTGRTLRKIEIGARAPASELQVSPDGKLVVTVWGRDVVLWWLDSGRVHNYNLDAVRLVEGWPLCVSPDCRYLACRTEGGFDVSDVQTGKFRGEFAWNGPFVSAAAFSRNGKRLAVGDYNGNLHVFEVVTP